MFQVLYFSLVQVLYLIVRRHREDSHHRVFLAHSTVRQSQLLIVQPESDMIVAK